MNWGSFSVKTFVIFIILWALLIFAQGNFWLINNIVPEQGVDIEMWVESFYRAGALSAGAGFICSAIWFYYGKTFSPTVKGLAMCSTVYGIINIAALALGILIAFVFILPAIDGQGFSFIAVSLLGVFGTYLSSIIAPASAVKYIPLFADWFHK